jgi:DNA polymerase
MTTDRAAAAAELHVLADQAAVCTACALCETRTQAVFSRGSSDAAVMVVGEAPGYNEDQQGLPFVGAAGKLLDNLLEEIGLDCDRDVYITNTLKCRPPGNRDPLPAELEACKSFLRRQLVLVDPQVVVTVGNFATKLLLKTDTGISRLRGQAYPWWHRWLVPTFHPSAALRGGDRVMEAMRHDLSLVAGLLQSAEMSALDPEPQPVPEPEPAESVQLGLFG